MQRFRLGRQTSPLVSILQRALTVLNPSTLRQMQPASPEGASGVHQDPSMFWIGNLVWTFDGGAAKRNHKTKFRFHEDSGLSVACISYCSSLWISPCTWKSNAGKQTCFHFLGFPPQSLLFGLRGQHPFFTPPSCSTWFSLLCLRVHHLTEKYIPLPKRHKTFFSQKRRKNYLCFNTKYICSASIWLQFCLSYILNMYNEINLHEVGIFVSSDGKLYLAWTDGFLYSSWICLNARFFCTLTHTEEGGRKREERRKV